MVLQLGNIQNLDRESFGLVYVADKIIDKHVTRDHCLFPPVCVMQRINKPSGALAVCVCFDAPSSW